MEGLTNTKKIHTIVGYKTGIQQRNRDYILLSFNDSMSVEININK